MQAFSQFGSDLDADTKARLALGERIVEVLKQGRNSPVRVGCQVAIVYAVTKGYLNDIPVKSVKNFEQKLFDKLEAEHNDLLCRFEQGSFENEDVEELKLVLSGMTR